MLSNETKIDWQFINNEELLNKLVTEVNKIALKYWNNKGLDNFPNAGLFKKETRIFYDLESLWGDAKQILIEEKK